MRKFGSIHHRGNLGIFGAKVNAPGPPERRSLRWYENYFTSSKWISSTIDSAIVAPLVVAFSVPLGALAAYSLARGRYPGRSLVSALAIFPLIVPQLITAVAIFFLYVQLKGDVPTAVENVR